MDSVLCIMRCFVLPHSVFKFSSKWYDWDLKTWSAEELGHYISTRRHKAKDITPWTTRRRKAYTCRHSGRRLGRDESGALPLKLFHKHRWGKSRGAAHMTFPEQLYTILKLPGEKPTSVCFVIWCTFQELEASLFCCLVYLWRTWSLSVLLSGALMKSLSVLLSCTLRKNLKFVCFCCLVHLWRTWSLYVFVVWCIYEELEACMFFLSGALMRTWSLHYDSRRTVKKAEKIVVQICCSLSSYAVLKMPTSFFPHWRRQFD